MLKDTPDIPRVEILRRLTSEHDYLGGKTAIYDYIKALRPPKQALLIICFEGVAREFSQHDFGEVCVTYEDDLSEKIHFYAGRLKFSRYMHVRAVPNQSIENVIPGILSFSDKVGGMAVIKRMGQAKPARRKTR